MQMVFSRISRPSVTIPGCAQSPRLGSFGANHGTIARHGSVFAAFVTRVCALALSASCPLLSHVCCNASFARAPSLRCFCSACSCSSKACHLVCFWFLCKSFLWLLHTIAFYVVGRRCFCSRLSCDLRSLVMGLVFGLISFVRCFLLLFLLPEFLWPERPPKSSAKEFVLSCMMLELSISLFAAASGWRL